MDELLTAKEAMVVLRCARGYLTAHAEEIGVERRGGRLFFRRSDLQAYRDRSYIRRGLVATRQESAPQRRLRVVPAGINEVTGRPFNERASR